MGSKAFALADDGAEPLPRLREHALLLAGTLSKGSKERISDLFYGAGLLKRVEKFLGDNDEHTVYACLAMVRTFAFDDDMKETFAMHSDIAMRCVQAVKRHTSNASVCEQGFGLFANLTIRKPDIASLMNGAEIRIMAVAQVVLMKHNDRPGVVRHVLQTLRNVASQDEAAAVELREAETLEQVKKVFHEHKNDAKWKLPVDVAKQFLREFRADDGIRAEAIYNAY